MRAGCKSRRLDRHHDVLYPSEPEKRAASGSPGSLGSNLDATLLLFALAHDYAETAMLIQARPSQAPTGFAKFLSAQS